MRFAASGSRELPREGGGVSQYRFPPTGRLDSGIYLIQYYSEIAQTLGDDLARNPGSWRLGRMPLASVPLLFALRHGMSELSAGQTCRVIIPCTWPVRLAPSPSTPPSHNAKTRSALREDAFSLIGSRGLKKKKEELAVWRGRSAPRPASVARHSKRPATGQSMRTGQNIGREACAWIPFIVDARTCMRDRLPGDCQRR